MAKLRPEQLNQRLQQGLPAALLISGDEPLLVQEAAAQVRQAARSQDYQERELYHVDPSFDWQQVFTSANSLSLFAEKKILELRLPSGKPGDKGSRALVEYTASPPADILLLIITGKLDKSTLNSKWFKALDQVGLHVPVWPVELDKLSGWIATRLHQAGLKADSRAVELLSARVEGNLLAAVQEIEKLKLLSTDGIVSVELMASVVADSARYDVFGLADRALSGDARGAVKSLHGLRGEGTDALAILWPLTRVIRQLLQAAAHLNQGKSMDWALQQVGFWSQRQPIARNALQRLRPAQLEQLLRQAGGVDRAIKGMRNAKAWDELLDLVLGLSGVTSLHPTNTRLSLKL